MRIVSTVEQFWHKFPGGTARATEETLAALATRRGIELTGVAARHSNSDPAVLKRLPAGMKVHYHWLPRPLLYDAWVEFGWPSIDNICNSDTVVWASAMIPPATKAPLVSTVHDLEFLDAPQDLTRRGRRLFPKAWRRVAEHSTMIVCPSEYVAQQCIRWGASKNQLAVVPWGVNEPACEASSAASVRHALNISEPYVLWVGPLWPRKNPTQAVAAMSKLDLRFVVVSSGDEANASLLEPLGEQVTRLGFVSDVELSALYYGARAFLYPSKGEGFGLPVLEAMIHGTPVVTSDKTATAEIGGDAALLVDPTDVAGIAETLVTATEGKRRDEFIQRGLERARSFTWQRTATGYLDAFRRAVL